MEETQEHEETVGCLAGHEGLFEAVVGDWGWFEKCELGLKVEHPDYVAGYCFFDDCADVLVCEVVVAD